jgi:steroid delta-isomerase-like uncharacterized protein
MGTSVGSDLVHRFLHVVETGVVDDPTVFADGYVYHDAMGNPHPLDEAIAMRRTIIEALSESTMSIEDTIMTDEKMLFRWRSEGTHTGDLLGVPATNARISIRGVTIIHVTHGRVKEMWDYVDLLGVMQQLGVVPPFSG